MFSEGHQTELVCPKDVKKRWQEDRRNIQKRSSWPRSPWWCDHSPRARHPGEQSQVGLRKHHYEQRGGDGIPKLEILGNAIECLNYCTIALISLAK